MIMHYITNNSTQSAIHLRTNFEQQCNNITASTSSSSSTNKEYLLKFGMDRILSNDICVKKNVKNLSYHSSFYNNSTNEQTYGGDLRIHTKYQIKVPCPIRPIASRVHTSRLLPILSDHPRQTNDNLISTSSSTLSNKRKRSWSRAVFSNLQRKGLERRFQIQKYITKPDRRLLAATLGLTDAQVKVWFQNRRMKWRHSSTSSLDNKVIQVSADSTQYDTEITTGTTQNCLKDD